MTAMYYIKAYFTKLNQQQHEIRRFAIDISPDNDVYNELKTKITSYLSNDQVQEFILQYNDEDNERITFSSNDELRSAIALNKDMLTLKIFVTFIEPIVQQQQKQQDTTVKECHTGVQCDNCNGPVIGFRYKCFACPDYDLCETCSAAGIHTEHNMIRITSPTQYEHLDDHLRQHFNNHQQRHHQHNMTVPSPPATSAFTPTQEYLQKIHAQIPHWLPNRQDAAHFGAHLQQHIDSLKTNGQTHIKNSKHYLENVGQFLQKTLKPHGINCEYHVDEQNPIKNEQQEEQISTTIVTTVSALDSNVASNSSEIIENNHNQEQAARLTIPSTEESIKIRNPLDRAIEDCMETMTTMGFIDVNGTLRELIRSKQGDINLVLDEINSRSYQI